ncbi:MAG TPA: (2Fe-2S)-binding protein [Bacteroidales bacterium]|nr:(2Fe-2S)-binding protein [Bacteroidales bacterium]
MATIQLTINNRAYTLDVDPQMPLLWVLRDFAGLKGTKFGCGISQCGVCTVHLDGVAVRSCQMPVSAVVGRRITTIEGLSENNNHPVQMAWIREQVPQCGYCHSGQIMSAAALLKQHPKPTDLEIDTAMQGNLCRCGTYQRIRKAIHVAADLMQQPANS